MTAKTVIEIITAFGSVATPIIVLILTAVGWKFRQSIERRNILEENMRTDRINIYNKILNPFIIMLTPDEVWKSDKKYKTKSKDQVAIGTILSVGYRQSSFELALLGSDGVMFAFNNLMQYFFNMGEDEDKGTKEAKKLMTLFGLFLLEIRKSMGNEETMLNEWDMIEWIITDARKIRNENN